MKRGISAVVIIALLLTGFSVFKNDIAMVLFKRAITQQLSTDIVADYPLFRFDCIDLWRQQNLQIVESWIRFSLVIFCIDQACIRK